LENSILCFELNRSHNQD